MTWNERAMTSQSNSHNPRNSKQTKNYQPVFAKGVSYDPRWWRSRWCFPITDPSWNVDIRARRSKHVRRANQVKSNGSSQKSQVKQGKSSKGKLMLIQHMLDVNMLVWSSNSSQESQEHRRKAILIQHMLHVNMLSSKNCLVKCVLCKSVWFERFLV